MMDRIRRRSRVPWKLDCQRFTRLRIRLVKRCSGASDCHANAMTFVEHLADPAHVEANLIDLARFYQHFLVEPLAVTQPPRVVNDQDRFSIWVNVAYAHDYIGISCG